MVIVHESVTLPQREEHTFDHRNLNVVRKFMVAVNGDRYSLLWHLLVFEGMRRGEAPD